MDLMLGDLVQVNGEAFKVISISYFDIGIFDRKNDFYYEHIDNIKPIPLTPEILEKNGFVANKHVYPYPYYEYINKEDKLKIGFAFPQGNRTSYKEPWVYIDSERVFVEHLPCIYAHELQHALRLCGVDKEITI